jgi:hypothetical protein
MSKTIEEILTPKPEARPRIYACSIADAAHRGLLKVGQTTRDVKQRVAEQLKTAAIENYKIELNESAECDDGSIFSDYEVRAALQKKGFEKFKLEWMRCALKDVKTVLTELRTGQRFTGAHHETFPMRREQAEAVDKTFDYYHSIWAENKNAVPRFLWNAKMRFGKTFTAYQLAKKLDAKRVLVLTFKPAVEDAWQSDLENHMDFDGWQYLSRSSGSDPTQIDRNQPVVYFGSFQDLPGRDTAGNIKPKNEWLHTVNWDLVVFDEYHFGAWRDTAKELFEGEEEWSSILMLRNLKSPETYFQAAFRVQSPWYIKNPNGDNPNEEEILKPVCFVFDFAPTRALRQLSEYGIGLSPNEANPENAVKELVSFLPVLAYDGANMTQIDAGGILDIAMAGTSATLLARKWESALLVNVDNDTLRRVLDNPEAMAAVERIEGWRSLGDNIIETIINKSEKVKELKNKAKEGDLTSKEKKELTDEEKEYKSKRKLVQEKLIKFATRIPAFMYLTDFRENTLQDVVTKLEPDLFLAVTGLTVKDFHLLVRLKVFNTEQMNQAVFAFRRYEDASLRYTGIESHQNLSHYGLYDTVVAKD